jgi:hypothetical protein
MGTPRDSFSSATFADMPSTDDALYGLVMVIDGVTGGVWREGDFGQDPVLRSRQPVE